MNISDKSKILRNKQICKIYEQKLLNSTELSKKFNLSKGRICKIIKDNNVTHKILLKKELLSTYTKFKKDVDNGMYPNEAIRKNKLTYYTIRLLQREGYNINQYTKYLKEKKNLAADMYINGMSSYDVVRNFSINRPEIYRLVSEKLGKKQLLCIYKRERSKILTLILKLKRKKYTCDEVIQYFKDNNIISPRKNDLYKDKSIRYYYHIVDYMCN